ncbi:hypothetical protein [Thalassorhabdomicrobium marinisediminis]|uniref:Secreted protein n=1 Tax=Thalassorhabdomicrobium marinisediminis TaxID=2170577 RepID=A0A2T7FYT2_9RHOB|nr:hypothetical protein [Thalassorhabdomicrobium marinisediminis]PVA07321.1 hypothetical protein DC363_05610 [Thalassorhabdomicrobium marinisediminis]
MTTPAPFLLAACAGLLLTDARAAPQTETLSRLAASYKQDAGKRGPCVSNGTDRSFYFAAEARSGVRRTGRLAPGEMLCTTGHGAGGVVSVYESPDVVEGCSRLVDGPVPEVLRRYADFDRCTWSSHDPE